MNAGELCELKSTSTLPVEKKLTLEVVPWLSGATAALWKEMITNLATRDLMDFVIRNSK
jgi:hypothetical protein